MTELEAKIEELEMQNARIKGRALAAELCLSFVLTYVSELRSRKSLKAFTPEVVRDNLLSYAQPIFKESSPGPILDQQRAGFLEAAERFAQHMPSWQFSD